VNSRQRELSAFRETMVSAKSGGGKQLGDDGHDLDRERGKLGDERVTVRKGGEIPTLSDPIYRRKNLLRGPRFRWPRGKRGAECGKNAGSERGRISETLQEEL